jgi:hypothetical protein
MKHGQKNIIAHLTEEWTCPLCLVREKKTNHMEHVWRIKVEVNVTLHGSKQSDSCFDCFTPRFQVNRRLVWFQAKLDVVAKTKMHIPAENQTQIIQSMPSQFTSLSWLAMKGCKTQFFKVKSVKTLCSGLPVLFLILKFAKIPFWIQGVHTKCIPFYFNTSWTERNRNEN